MREHLVDALVEMPTVVESCERIRLRHVAQLLVDFEQLLLSLLECFLQALDAEHRAQARLELRKVDRLGDVVVGTGLEPFHLVLGRVERRLHDDRNEGQRLVALDLPRDLDAADFGHHDVEQDEIGRRRRHICERVMAVVCRGGGVPPALEAHLQHLDVVLVVVDDEDARRGRGCCARGGRWGVSRHSASRPCRGIVALPPRPRAVRRAWRGIRRSRLPSPSRDRTRVRAR